MAVADVTVALVPCTVTVLEAGVVEKPVPTIFTVVPTGPVAGENAMIDTEDELYRPIDSTFPTAS